MLRHGVTRLTHFTPRSYATMATAFQYHPLPLPSTANPAYFKELGRRVEGFDPETVTSEQMAEIKDKLYAVSGA